ncbi:MAG TPA: hypothetical protein VK822_03685 [Acetobacteraceae bacterium]|jgi:hypothetical protein|nr:hypothetical protein [Acetobacteraceae bacterium]HTB45163.1 hypothetical protein [Acetobacteraceae bacterium]
MTITHSRGQPDRVARLGDGLPVVMDRLFSAVPCQPALIAPRPARRVRRDPVIGHPWSAEDSLMVIGWVLAMPFAAARFEHAILTPPFAHLPAGGSFVVASAEALLQLAVAAKVARSFTAIMRRAARQVVRGCGGWTAVHVPGRRDRAVSLSRDDATWSPVV